MRVTLVTGAAGGIGSATVARMVADGYGVVALDVRPEVDGLAGERVVPVVGDVRSPEALDSAARLAVETYGGLHAVVAAAAVIRGGPRLWEAPAGQLDELLDVDVRGVWNTAAATIPVLLQADDPSRCSFVAVASAAGHRGLFGLSAYAAAKHAVVGIVRGLAADLVGTGVTASGVSPGATRTPMLTKTAGLYGLADPDLLGDQQLLRRLIEPEEIAAAIAFSCSLEGAVLNGRVLQADGGPV
jgi:SDR family mycofactocin-dependent oxidoreductase